MSAKGHPPPIAERLKRYLTAHPEILDAYLFGSRARGDAARHSDIDVAVYVDPLNPVNPASRIAS